MSVGWRPLCRLGGLGLFAIALAAATPQAAFAQTSAAQPDYSTIGALLLGFFGVVVLFESGFQLLFQWRLFREFLPVAGWRTPIMYIVSALLTYRFPTLDVFNRAISAFAGVTTAAPTGSSLTFLISAAILAGGSAGMMRIFERLGIRSAPTEPVPLAIDQTKAWLSVRVSGALKDPKTVVVKIEQAPNGTAIEHAGIAGTLRKEKIVERFVRVMGRDLSRFPPSGGYLVEAGKPYKITVEYPDQVPAGGNASTERLDVFSQKVIAGNQPPVISFASRAIVDLTVELPPTP
ncbi:hypothetical protein NKI96_24460 [Mesorhizobium sp. M0292]|uniref:hypothetical protein n=1 Tax=Mesorhizobium sp. M0292 TaxID=2956929 RepID=UPI00333B7D01